MSKIVMTVEYTIEFRDEDDEAELSLEGDILPDLIGVHGKWQDDGWRVWGARVQEEVRVFTL